MKAAAFPAPRNAFPAGPERLVPFHSSRPWAEAVAPSVAPESGEGAWERLERTARMGHRPAGLRLGESRPRRAAGPGEALPVHRSETGTDPRSLAQKREALSSALAEAEDLLQSPETTVEDVAAGLPPLRWRHGLRSLDLVRQSRGTFKVSGHLNPRGETGSSSKRKRGEKEPPSLEQEEPSESQAEKKKKLTLVYPSELTGDIWHSASALATHRRYNPQGNDLRLKMVRAKSKSTKDPRAKSPSQKRSEPLLKYLSDIGLGKDVSTVDLPSTYSQSSAKLSGGIQAVAEEETGQTFRTRKEERAKRALAKQGQYAEDQKVSTSILMKYMKSEDPTEVQEFLRRKLSRGVPPSVKGEVRALRDQLRERYELDALKRKLLLINNRRAKSNEPNQKHNTSPEQFQRLSEIAEEEGMAPLGIGEGEGNINIFGGESGGGIDKRRTAYFWKKVHSLQKKGLVHGLIGGRSGSMDIAAFQGVNTPTTGTSTSRRIRTTPGCG